MVFLDENSNKYIFNQVKAENSVVRSNKSESNCSKGGTFTPYYNREESEFIYVSDASDTIRIKYFSWLPNIVYSEEDLPLNTEQVSDQMEIMLHLKSQGCDRHFIQVKIFGWSDERLQFSITFDPLIRYGIEHEDIINYATFDRSMIFALRKGIVGIDFCDVSWVREN